MSLPPGVTADRVEEIDVGLSGARVARLYVSGRPVAVFKAAGTDRPDLVSELAGTERRLRRLADTPLPVPRLLDSGEWRGERWLTMEHRPGRAAHEPGHERSALIATLARALRELHTASLSGPPFPLGPDVLLERARERVAAGLVDRSWRAAEHRPREGGSPAGALRGLAERLSRTEVSGPVLLHGDYCLPNVLVDDDGRWSLIDLGRMGVGDRHLDLVDMTGSMLSDLNPSFGPRDAEAFLDAYGRDRIDPERVELYRELDAFFWPV
ncbi:aminoglycoside 3'-phosphotransferase [Nocardiopsis sp. N85]|uniref:aminoglycoside 3'-phosphotransferase n=1 Tax=Nocardiopsis sp. N85 TaxID=3029400 RepID=UPI00237FB123|nr:aminoglycoside 3'-phosphotransferase [Nocardiopsis sp. N85]MDE3721324.1 aminoglycoside 3'-phosphotransferase [Nocardiopsis sp. N85]